MKNQEILIQDTTDYFDSLNESYERPKITVSFNKNECIVHISKMYHGLGKLVSFSALKWLSEKLGTDKINLENEYYIEGCESCDWGSEHSVDIKCYDVQV
jgi:hypothetical protein